MAVETEPVEETAATAETGLDTDSEIPKPVDTLITEDELAAIEKSLNLKDELADNKALEGDEGKASPAVAEKVSLSKDQNTVLTDDLTATAEKVVNQAPADKKSNASVVDVAPVETGGVVKKFGIMAGAFAIILVLLAVLLDDNTDLEAIKAEALEMQKQREQEELKLKQLQLEAQALKNERDAAIAKAKAEAALRAKQEAQQITAEKAAAAAKAAEARRMRAERKRVAAAKERERKAMEAEAEAKAEARYAKREALRLAEERRAMQQRLDEEIRMKHQEEARRLELERIDLERQQLQSAASTEPVVETPVIKESKQTSIECSGPAARFKSGCR